MIMAMVSNGITGICNTPFYFKECASSSTTPSSHNQKTKMAEFGDERTLSDRIESNQASKNHMDKVRPADVRLFRDGQNISNPKILERWIAEFMPKLEPPRFFRPLCNRLMRRNEILRDQERHYIDKIRANLEEGRKRLKMSITKVREEQKAQLKEKYKNRKRRRHSKSTNNSNS